MGCHFLLQGIFPTTDRTRVSCISCIDRKECQFYFTTVPPRKPPTPYPQVPTQFNSQNCKQNICAAWGDRRRNVLCLALLFRAQGRLSGQKEKILLCNQQRNIPCMISKGKTEVNMRRLQEERVRINIKKENPNSLWFNCTRMCLLFIS